MTLEKLLPELRYERGVEEAVSRKISKDEKVIKEIAQTAYLGDNFNFALCKRMPLTRLAVITYLLVEKYNAYKSIGVSDDVIFDTFRDVSLRASLYYKKSGKIGLAKDDVIWFRHMMNAGIFKIGALQFQPFKMLYLDKATTGEAYMTFSEHQKNVLPNGAPVLNCHIQRGADICTKAVSESLKKAIAFFGEYFPSVRYRAFLCYSWLLYPPMLRRLPDESNIKQFANQFSIIGACGDWEQAMENLFAHGRANIAYETTSLQRMAIEHKENFGFGCGIILI